MSGVLNELQKRGQLNLQHGMESISTGKGGKKRGGGPQKMCSALGCILADRHTGMHLIPQPEVRTAPRRRCGRRTALAEQQPGCGPSSAPPRSGHRASHFAPLSDLTRLLTCLLT